jgi:hypothetical protein
MGAGIAALLCTLHLLASGTVLPDLSKIQDAVEHVKYSVKRDIPPGMVEFINENFDLYDGSVEDIVYVAQRVDPDINPLILVSILQRESGGGDPNAVRYCAKYGKHKSGRYKGRTKCIKEYGCAGCWKKGHHNKRMGKFYSHKYFRKHALDCGRWQLRHNPNGWSWLRFYAKQTKQKVTIDCAFDQKCARKAMIEAINHLDSHRGKRKCRKPEYFDQFQWIGGWNTCGAYKGHVGRYLEYIKQYKKWVTEKGL